MSTIKDLYDLTKDISLLYAEDDPILSQEMAHIFTDLFKDVTKAKDGVEALDHFNQYHDKHKKFYDLVITDINMPNMDGIELCREIISRNPDQIIIVMSAHNESEYLFKLINLGVNHFILKPVNLENILAVLQKSASVIQAERRMHKEHILAKEENQVLSVANEELEQQVKVEMYNAEANTAILQQYKDAIDKILLVSKTDPKGNITYANDHFCRVSGYHLDELLGQPHSIVRHPDNPSSLFDTMWQTLKSKKPWYGLLKNRSKSGTPYYVQTSIIPLLDPKGQLIEYIALREDVTESIRYQQRLEEKNKRVDAILDNQESIVLLINAHGSEPKLTHINAKFFEEFNYQNIHAFMAKHRCICELFVTKEGYLEPTTEATHWTDPLIKEPEKLHKVLMINKKSEEKTYSVHHKELWLEDERFFLITFTDITEIERLRHIAEDTEKTKSAFLANMSHEIRTPINGINGFTQLLKNSELNDKQRHYIDLIDTSTKLLIGTINDILDFSKIESHKMELSYTQIDLIQEIKNFVKLFVQKAEEKSIQFEIDIDKEIYPYVSVDTLHLKQILSNLISNALKFTSKGGTINFKVEKSKSNESMQTLKFSLQDNGIGIPKERHEAIFQSFTQADNSTTRKFGGTGLGLSISSSLVELMGGKLQLESQEGEGSTFYFSLNFHKENKFTTVLEEDDASVPDDIKLNLYVLIVEDYDINQILIQTLLDNLGIRSDIANDGQEAVQMSRENRYDLILMDINMPIMNGIDATRIIKKEDHNPVPIVALTANILDDDIRRALDAGMMDSLIKPIQPKKLLRVLQTYAKTTSHAPKKEVSSTPMKEIQEPVFAFQDAKDALGLPDKTLVNIIIKFASSTKILIEQIIKAIKDDDVQTITAAAHKMKGSASTLCFNDIAQHAQALESTPGDDHEKLSQHIQAIATAIQAIEVSLKKLEKA